MVKHSSEWSGMVDGKNWGKIKKGKRELMRKIRVHKGFYIAGLFMLVLAGFLIYANSFVLFQPVLFDNGYKEVKLSQKSFENLKLVLKFYGVTYKEEHGQVYVRRQLHRDREMMFNYTKKAIDEHWLQEHLPNFKQ